MATNEAEKEKDEEEEQTTEAQTETQLETLNIEDMEEMPTNYTLERTEIGLTIIMPQSKECQRGT